MFFGLRGGEAVSDSPDEENPELEENDRPAVIGSLVYFLIYVMWFFSLASGMTFSSHGGAFGWMGIEWFGFKIPLLAICLLIFLQSFEFYKFSSFGNSLCMLLIISSFLFAWWLLFQAYASC